MKSEERRRIARLRREVRMPLPEDLERMTNEEKAIAVAVLALLGLAMALGFQLGMMS